MSSLEEAAKFLSPDTIPVGVGILPAAWIKHGEELKRIAKDFPQFFGTREVDLSKVEANLPETYRTGLHTDEWGCVWSNISAGNEAIVTGHPIKCEEDIFNLKIPSNRGGRLPHGFFYLRLLDLCGFELAMELFAEEGEALNVLIDKVLQYNCIQIQDVIDSGHRGWFGFGDDLGMQKGLAIGPERWRKYLKPCYQKMYGLIKNADPNAFIYMHTDGCIWEIMQDLVECGVDMINPQYRANGLDHLVEECRIKHRIAINLDLDRQLFPVATPSQIDDHVRECVEALYMPEGGLGLSCELNYEIPLENIVAALEALEKYRHYKK